MTEDDVHESLRDRTRRAVRNELLDIGQELFAEEGYEQVTVDEIAAAAGMSRRSFFRYFSSKDSLVLGKYDRQGELFVEALNARPHDEPLWTALRRMVDGGIAYAADPVLGKRAAEMERIVHTSGTLHGGFLERMEKAKYRVADAARHREAERGSGLGELEVDAVVTAAFSVLLMAGAYAREHGTEIGSTLDRAMEALSPSIAM